MSTVAPGLDLCAGQTGAIALLCRGSRAVADGTAGDLVGGAVNLGGGAPAQSAGSNPSILDFITDPTASMEALSVSSMRQTGVILTNPDLIPFQNTAVLQIYGLCGAVGVAIAMICTLVAHIGNVNASDAGKPFGRFLGYILSLGLTPVAIFTINRGVHLIALPFINSTTFGYGKYQEVFVDRLQGNYITAAFPAADGTFVFLMTVVFGVVSFVLLVELMIWAAVTLAVFVFAPLYSLGWIFAPQGEGNSSGRGRSVIYRYIDVLAALLATPAVVSILLALSTALLGTGIPIIIIIGLGLLVVTLTSPLALLTFLPFTELAQGQGAVGKQSLIPAAAVAAAISRYARRI